MTLIKSISGIRGTIGGMPGDNLTPPDVVKFTSAYARLIQLQNPQKQCAVVIARDSRISGHMVYQLVSGTLMACGIHVLDLGQATTPTTELEVVHQQAQGGIILTASHNPKQWNALKLLNDKGEFISAAWGEHLLQIAETLDFNYANVDQLGTYLKVEGALERHIQAILQLPYVNAKAIQRANFNIVVDPINSIGALAVPQLLLALGLQAPTCIHNTMHGDFAHNPEPLPEHLKDLCQAVTVQKASLGISVDPDVDRLALVCEDGTLFGEEYTLVAVAQYMLKCIPGTPTVSNLSSSRALSDITRKAGAVYEASAVGEVHVVSTMKRIGARIGGEGNGGIIVADLHYGRDALAGIALFLSWLAEQNIPLSACKAQLPRYVMSKHKVELDSSIALDHILNRLATQFSDAKLNTQDGLKIDFDDAWVHLRKSNTEPIIRIYTESATAEQSETLAKQFAQHILNLTH